MTPCDTRDSCDPARSLKCTSFTERRTECGTILEEGSRTPMHGRFLNWCLEVPSHHTVTFRSLKLTLFCELGGNNCWNRSGPPVPCLTTMFHTVRCVQAPLGSANVPKNIPMPRGVWWLDKSAHNHDVVYGEKFILQRPKRGGPGLVLVPQNPGLQVFDPQDPPPPGPLTVMESERGFSGPPILLNYAGWAWDVTDYNVAEIEEEQAGKAGPWAQTDCLGIVLHSSSAKRAMEEPPPSRNPRRTRKVRFTCNLCGNTYVRPVNPHAWTKGSVFAKCEECNVVHKLVDGLKLFHEYHDWRLPRVSKLVIPEGLPQAPTIDYHIHPSLYTPEHEEPL
eukprot:jgi/Botrbrau1/19523/Bobra.0035s0022.1